MAFLLIAVMLGGVFGIKFPQYAIYLQPVGIAFVQLLLMTLVPLIFFSITSAIANSRSSHLTLFFKKSFVVLSLMGVLAATYMAIMLLAFPPEVTVSLPANLNTKATINILEKLPSLISVDAFYKLFSTEHVLPLVIFAILFGMSVSEKNASIVIKILDNLNETFLKLISYIMKLAPVGFFAYFASIASNLHFDLLASYFSLIKFYYLFSSIFIVFVLTIVTILFTNQKSFTFWKAMLEPSITAIATCSSAASIAASLKALNMLKVNNHLARALLPFSILLQKQGTILGAMVKIYFLFSLYHLPFTLPVIFAAMGSSILVGCVMGSIPSGGLIGETFILSIYGFPIELLMLLSVFSLAIDPLATLINVLGANLSCLILSNQSKALKLVEERE